MKANVSGSVVSKVGLPKTATGMWGRTAGLSIAVKPLSQKRKRGSRSRVLEVWGGEASNGNSDSRKRSARLGNERRKGTP